MTKKTQKLPVMVRYEGKGRADREDWHINDLIAIFPDQAADCTDPRAMMCYSMLGQHSSCHSNYAGQKTKPATAKQTRTMLRELHKLGYRNLRVVSRPSPHHARNRREQIERL